MKKHATLTAKRYLVGIPVPYLDRNGQKLDGSLTAMWTKKALLELTECFGGATPLSAPATNRVGENVLFEEGQTLVLSGCDDRDEYLLKRDRIQEFVEHMGRGVNEASLWKAEMKKPKVTFIEIVPDADLKKKEKEATETMKRFYPHCGPVRLYRTEDGRVGFQAHLSVTAGDRKRLDQAYRAVMKVLGEKRGRPAGEKTVQAKLHLPLPLFETLKKVAKEMDSTMSSVVADSLRARFVLGRGARGAGGRREAAAEKTT